MTIRAVILGLLGAMFIAAVVYINDHVWMLTQFVASHFPVFVFGSLIAFVLFINPLLFLFRREWRLKPAELAVALMLLLVVCSIPSWGFLATFSKVMVTPAQTYRTQQGWQKAELRGYVPKQVLPAEGEYVPEFTDTFMRGGRAQDANIDVADVPWHYWQTPLLAGVPLIVLMAVALVCLGLVLHRQWTTAERLRYPIADIATSLLAQDPDRPSAPMFRTGMFWWGLALVLFLRIFNGLHLWFPQDMVEIPMIIPFGGVANFFTALKGDQWCYAWLHATIFPTIVAIGFMLASDVSLSLGLAPPLFGLVTIVLLRNFDTNIGRDDYMLGGGSSFQRFGSYLAMALVIAYTGRRYYKDVLKRAFFVGRKSDVPNYAAWACRIFLLAVTGMVLLICSFGLDWPFALLFVVLAIITFLGMSRINCESGLFLIVPRWQPIAVILGICGAMAVGPQAIMIISILCVVVTLAPWESLMPFFMNGLKMCTTYQIKPGRVGVSAIGVYLLGLVVAIPVVLWATHNYGVLREPPSWSNISLPLYYYKATKEKVDELSHDAELSDAKNLTTSQRFSFKLGRITWDWGSFPPVSWKDGGFEYIKSKPFFVRSMAIGIGLVLVVSFFRLRLPWWPIHPVLFMVWGTLQMALISASFLLGWMIKSIVTNLGGTQTYQRTKTVMFGIIAGDLLGGVLLMASGIIYHLITNKPAPDFWIFPVLK